MDTMYYFFKSSHRFSLRKAQNHHTEWDRRFEVVAKAPAVHSRSTVTLYPVAGLGQPLPGQIRPALPVGRSRSSANS